MTLRCGIYARYSTDKERPVSIDDQVPKCKEHALKEGWQVLDDHIYTDQAVNGSTDDRAGLNGLIEAAISASEPFEVILVDDTSRLSRKLADSLRIFEKLRYADVRIVFVSQGIDSGSEQAEILVATHGIVDSLYIRELGKKVYRGEEGCAIKGLHTGGRCFGYHSQPIEDPNRTDNFGRPAIVGVRLVVDQVQASTVRRIFELYASGYSFKRIAKLLNSEGVQSPQPQRGRISRSWCPSSIRVILRNDRYRGVVIWARTKKVRVPETGRRIKRPRSPDDWVMAKVPEQRIISDELWERVQQRLEQVKQFYGNAGRRAGLLRARSASSPYLFSGFLVCGACGARMNIVSGRGQRRHASYGCPLNAQRGVCSNNLRIRRDVLERGLLSRLQAEVLQPEVIKYTLDRFDQALASVLESWRGELAQLEIRKAKLEEELKNLTAAIAGGTYSASIIEAITVRESEIRAIANRMLESRPESVKTRLIDVREFVLSRLGNLCELLNRDPITARTELAKHVRLIKLYPAGAMYKACGDWDYLGDARMVQLRPAVPFCH
jgi:site-specific DNA recombinase